MIVLIALFSGEDLAENLPNIQRQYNTGVHRSLGLKSPFEDFYGRKPSSYIGALDLLPQFNPDIPIDEAEISQWKRDVKEARNVVDQAQKRATEAMVKLHKRKFPLSEYNVGESVVIKLDISRKKIKAEGLKNNYTSIGKIIERGDSQYKIQYVNNSKLKKREWFLVSSITL